MEEDTYAVVISGIEPLLCADTNAIINANLASGKYSSAKEYIHTIIDRAMQGDVIDKE
jgi:hypothetical protein